MLLKCLLTWSRFSETYHKSFLINDQTGELVKQIHSSWFCFISSRNQWPFGHRRLWSRIIDLYTIFTFIETKSQGLSEPVSQLVFVWLLLCDFSFLFYFGSCFPVKFFPPLWLLHKMSPLHLSYRTTLPLKQEVTSHRLRHTNSFKIHTQHLTQKGKLKLGFLNRIKGFLPPFVSLLKPVPSCCPINASAVKSCPPLCSQCSHPSVSSVCWMVLVRDDRPETAVLRLVVPCCTQTDQTSAGTITEDMKLLEQHHNYSPSFNCHTWTI